MSLNLTSITINTIDPQPMLQFYTALGIHFQKVPVSKGSEVLRAQVGGIEFSLFHITQIARKTAPALQLTFQVKDVDFMVKSLVVVPNAMCVLDPIEIDGITKAIMIDPDGHSIELVQNNI